MNPPSLLTRLEVGLRRIDIALSPDAQARLIRYAEEIIHWNRRINLTGAKTVEAFIDGPLFDALTLLKVLPDAPDSFVDIGSGGGLPGIPAIIARSPKQATLVEPRAKRVTFLHHAVHLLSLKVTVVESRDENLAGGWTDAVAQAVFEPTEWLKRACRLVVPGGRIYVLSAESLSVDALPDGAAVDAEYHCVRPAGEVPRYAYRIVTSG